MSEQEYDMIHCCFKLQLAIVCGLSAALLMSLSPQRAEAAIVIDLPEVNLISDGVNPTLGSLGVTLSVTGVSPLLSGFNLDFSVGGTAVTFNAPTTPTTAATPLFTGGTFVSSSSGQSVLAAHDLFDPTPTSVLAVDGRGLVKVTFRVAPGASGSFPLTFGNLNLVVNNLAMAVPVTFVGGSINVTTAVPECGAAAGMAVAGAVAATLKFLRRRRTP